ncbi:hypothetical protein PT974_06467 [Cladobotryum mycophilum]|uniref:Uncharacterized protein n=1 Tax=Cladobotryum mycophilum TaxID=491253 RepID=A0ABR0SLJ4_9HYPO
MDLQNKSYWDLSEEDVQVIAEQLRTKAQADHRARIPLDRLDAEHHAIFTRAINNVLSTELAVFTYAQIVDGLPTEDVAYDARYPGLFGEHPINEHENLCPGAMEKARELCKAWKPEMLSFNPELVNSFQQAAPGSKEFETRLIELVAVTLHQFGIILYQLDLRLHRGDIESTVTWRMPPEPRLLDIPPRPTLFNHQEYLDDAIYPDGVAELVGYWAENRILGGVVLFDRKGEGSRNRLEPPNVYFHPSRERLTHRIVQLRDDQQRALVDFLQSDPANTPDASVPSPLPVLVDKENPVRVDSHKATLVHQIYRDIWERKPLPSDDVSYREKRPQGEVDYPAIRGSLYRINAMHGLHPPEKGKQTQDRGDLFR